MGYSLEFVAVKGKQPEAVRHVLELDATGQFEPFPESEITAISLSNGWYLVVANRDRVASDSTLHSLTRECEAVTCYVEEHVMCSSATGWRDGVQVWSIIHESEKGIDHLEAKGDLPPNFIDIRKQLIERQNAANDEQPKVDYIFDIPVELVASITGFRYDSELPEVVGIQFEVLQRVQPLKRSWFSRIIRR